MVSVNNNSLICIQHVRLLGTCSGHGCRGVFSTNTEPHQHVSQLAEQQLYVVVQILLLLLLLYPDNAAEPMRCITS